MMAIFTNRAEAGRALAARLEGLVGLPCVVAAIPRGGVPVALPVASRLGAPLTVIYARKLTSSAAPEL
ncbi:MAG TPA: phosphoribosyltransferase, partial [Methylomirabilota bacterium]|nr:phosphoribosyltransferase [Methylomirabilota bacterium]